MQLDFFKAYCYYLHLPKETMYRMAFLRRTLISGVGSTDSRYLQGKVSITRKARGRLLYCWKHPISWLGGGYRVS